MLSLTMANPSFIHDLSVTSRSIAWFNLKTKMLITGTGNPSWIVTTSGTGVGGVYAQLGDVITSASVCANDLAWWVTKGHGITDGSTTWYQQICWQVNSAGQCRIKVSPRVGFVAGSPSPSQTPYASDETFLLGGGTDASPTFETLWPASGNWMQARIDGTTDAVWAATYATGGGLPTALLLVETTPVLYSYGGSLIDKAPWVYSARSGSDCAIDTTLSSELYGPLGWLAYGIASIYPGSSAIWCRLPAGEVAVRDSVGVLQAGIPNGLAQDPDLTTTVIPSNGLCFLRRRALSGQALGPKESGDINTTGQKGYGTSLLYSGIRSATPSLQQVVDSAGNNSYVLGMGDLLLQWELGLPPAV